jgi:hypothetical protein
MTRHGRKETEIKEGMAVKEYVKLLKALIPQ